MLMGYMKKNEHEGHAADSRRQNVGGGGGVTKMSAAAARRRRRGPLWQGRNSDGSMNAILG